MDVDQDAHLDGLVLSHRCICIYIYIHEPIFSNSLTKMGKMNPPKTGLYNLVTWKIGSICNIGLSCCLNYVIIYLIAIISM